MATYIMKCNLCGYETEIMRPMSDTSQIGCKREDRFCSGVMENITMTRQIPHITRHSMPTRNIPKVKTKKGK